MKKLRLLGIGASLAWLGIFAMILWTKRGDAAALKLNEWGDFLSGATAPLALMWLVIGYFLQGEELHLNTKALQMQEQELKNQVRETAILAANSERQAIAAEQMASAALEDKQRTALKDLADLLPIFRPKGGSHSSNNIHTVLRNVGATVTALSVDTESPNVSMAIHPKDVFESDGEGWLRVTGATAYPFPFVISFSDRMGRTHKRRYEMIQPHQIREISAI